MYKDKLTKKEVKTLTKTWTMWGKYFNEVDKYLEYFRLRKEWSNASTNEAELKLNTKTIDLLKLWGKDDKDTHSEIDRLNNMVNNCNKRIKGEW